MKEDFKRILKHNVTRMSNVLSRAQPYIQLEEAIKTSSNHSAKHGDDEGKSKSPHETFAHAPIRTGGNLPIRDMRPDPLTAVPCLHNSARSASSARPISVVTGPITGSINSPHNVGVNLHYGGILKDNYTPKTPYKEPQEL